MFKKIKCDSITLADLKKHENYKLIEGRSKMNKAELCKAINKSIKKSKNSKLSKDVSKKSKSVETSSKKIKKSKSVKNETPSKKMSPKKSILTHLPTEIHEKILLETDPITLLNACNTNKEALNFCLNDGFWKKYYTMRGLKFKPYDYSSRIKEAKTELMLVMDITKLVSECDKDKITKGICKPTSSNDFWKRYFKLRDLHYGEYDGVKIHQIAESFLIKFLMRSGNTITDINGLNLILGTRVSKHDLGDFMKEARHKGMVKVECDKQGNLLDFTFSTNKETLKLTIPNRGLVVDRIYELIDK